MAKKHKKSQAARSISDDAYFDVVVNTNVYADLHRILQDRLDCDFSTPASANEFDPAEISRRSAHAVISDTADAVALKWKDFAPNAEAVLLSEMTPLEARQAAICGLKETLAYEAVDADAGVRTEIIEAYQDRRKVGVELTDETLQAAVTDGIAKGRKVIAGMFEWLEEDEPSRNYPDAAEQRAKAIQTSWEITCKHVQARIPEEEEPKDLEAVYRLAYLDVAQNAMLGAFNLMAKGTTDPDSDVHDTPRLFAGSIMTELGIPQPYIDPGPDADEEEQLKEEGMSAPPTPMNGEIAESPQAVQMRELMMVFNAIGEDVLIGELRKDVKKTFKRMAREAFAPDEEEFFSPEQWALSLQEKKPELDLKVSKKVKAEAADETDEMIREIIADLVVEMKTKDGWVLDRSKLETTDAKMAISPPPRVQMMPHTAILQ